MYEKIGLWCPGTLPQAPFFVKKQVFGVGTLPQAPFICEKTRFWSWNVAAGAFYLMKKHVFGSRNHHRIFFRDTIKKIVFL
ncbi:MAG: hypothetical protein ACFHHU_01300 [Porticoccaceae bacterium]